MSDPAYILRPVYPPEGREFRGLNFLGGNPWLPKHVKWPRTDGGIPMSFLGQVRLADLPRRFRLGDGSWAEVDLLPRKGFLYFFAELAEWGAFEEAPGSVAVIWAEITDGMREVPPPEDLTGRWQVPQEGIWGEDSFPERTPKASAKVPVTVVPYASNPSFNQLRVNMKYQANRADRDIVDIRELTGDWQVEALNRLFGPRGPGLLTGEPTVGLGLPWLGYGAADRPHAGGEIWDLPEDGRKPWPWAWLVVDCTAQAVAAARGKAWRGEAEAARAWIARADAAGLHTGVPKRDAAEFRDWMQTLAHMTDPDEPVSAADLAAAKAAREDTARFGLRRSVRSHLERIIGRRLPQKAAPGRAPAQAYGLERAIANGIAAAVPFLIATSARSLLPQRLIALLAAHYDTRFRGHEVHQMLGAPWSVQNVAVTRAKQVMLLQLVPDERLGWHWGDLGTLQIWIDEADLRARRFDRIEHTLESH